MYIYRVKGIQIISLLIFILFISCTSIKHNVIVIQEKTNQPVILRINKNKSQIRFIHFPIKIKITNNSSQKESFYSIKYNYNSIRGTSALLFEEHKKGLKRSFKSDAKFIKPKESKEYIISSAHYLKQDNIKLLFSNYLEKMQKENSDTLVIGSMIEFKQKYPEFVKNILGKDSLKLFFKKQDSKDFNVIKIPIKF